MATIKTGAVYQRTVKGPNYLCVGTTMVDGERYIVSVKNGNIGMNGKSRRMEKSNGRVTVFAHSPNDIARIHQVRQVDVGSIFTLGKAEPSIKKDLKRIITKGVATAAELPSIAELR